MTSTYNNLNLLSSRQVTASGGIALRADFAYTARHQLGTVTRYDTLTTGTKVGETDYVYDDAMRVSSITHKNGSGTTLASFVYGYDAASRLTTETIGGTTTTYSYDATNQLTGDGTSTWGYDANGNRNTGGSTPTTGNRLTSDGTYTYTYDADSNVKTKTDASGNHWDYTYDAANEMTKATYYNHSMGTITSTTVYSYGPFGERLKAVHTESGNNWTHEFAYDAWNPEKLGSEGNSAFDVWGDLDGSGTLTTRYIDGDGIDNVLARVASGGATEQWLLADHLGSIRNITNSSGSVVNTITYDAWGNLSQTGSGANDVGRYAFTGRERDVETGLQYNRARYYDPFTGRWMTQDPLGFDAGDSNLNRYVKNAPTNHRDPTGMDSLADLETALTQTVTTKGGVEEATRIAAAIKYTYEKNRKIVFPRVRDERNKGYYCYEWAYAFEDAFKNEAGKNFKASVEGAVTPDGRVHFWLRIESLETGKVVFVDDGFMNGSYVHDKRPEGGDYNFDRQVPNDNPRTKCDVPPAYLATGKQPGQLEREQAQTIRYLTLVGLPRWGGLWRQPMTLKQAQEYVQQHPGEVYDFPDGFSGP